MKNLFKTIFIFSLALFLGCESDEDLTLQDSIVAFEPVLDLYTISENSSMDIDIVVATSSISDSNRTFPVEVNLEESNLTADYSVPSSVTIPANSNTGVLTVSVTDTESLTPSSEALVIQFVDEVEALYEGQNVILNIAEECLDTITDIEFTFDGFAEEASWELFSLAGGQQVLINQGGQNAAYSALDNSSLTETICLESGTYGIIVRDSYGDGGTEFVVSANGEVLTSGTVPGGNPANDPTSIAEIFTIQ